MSRNLFVGNNKQTAQDLCVKKFASFHLLVINFHITNFFVRFLLAQLVVRRLAVRQARVRISARHPMKAPLAERRREEDSR